MMGWGSVILVLVLVGCATQPPRIIYTLSVQDPCLPHSGDGHPDQFKGQSFNTPDTECI